MCKNSGSNSQKRCGHLDFCAVKITAWHRNYSIGFSVFSISDVKLDLIMVIRSQFSEYLRETSHKHALEHLGAAGPKINGFFFSSYGKCLSIIDFFEGL